jgi:tetratricopeptide (TPR) repeat protein
MNGRLGWGWALACCAWATLAPAQEIGQADAQGRRFQGKSLLGRDLYSQVETEEIKASLEAAKMTAADAIESAEAQIAHGVALAGVWRYREAIDVYTKAIERHPGEAMLYRHRGHRYISVRDFERAVADLKKAAELREDSFDIWYHLGLAHFLKGEYAEAERAYRECVKTVENNPPSLVAVSNWLYAALRMQNKKAEADRSIARITAEMNAGANGSYHRLLLFFKGEIEEEKIFEGEPTELELGTTGFGLGLWHRYNDAPEKAKAWFDRVLATDYWPSFGFIAAEALTAKK